MGKEDWFEPAYILLLLLFLILLYISVLREYLAVRDYMRERGWGGGGGFICSFTVFNHLLHILYSCHNYIVPVVYINFTSRM